MKWIVKGKINVLEVAEVLCLISRKLPAEQPRVKQSDAGTTSQSWSHRVKPQTSDTRPDPDFKHFSQCDQRWWSAPSVVARFWFVWL